MTDTLPEVTDEAVLAPRNPLRTTLIAILGVAVLIVAVSGGYLWGSHGKSDGPSFTAVDAGFARDMSTHHDQAITMATYTRDNTDNGLVKAIAYDVESSQSVQLGEMTGWLQQWDVSRNTNSPMAWMTGHNHLEADGLMPGMATPAQMTKLQTLHGTALSIFFLQLMIHHHQGGLEMAQFADQHASLSYVRTLAGKIYQNQSNEIVQMEQLLRSLGGSPLPPPED